MTQEFEEKDINGPLPMNPLKISLLLAAIILFGLDTSTNPALLCAATAEQEKDSVSQGAAQAPDKVEVVKTKTGNEIIKITGQMSRQYYDQLKREHEASKTILRNLPANEIEKYRRVTLPHVKTETSTYDEKNTIWYTIASQNFVVGIEENEAFGTKTAEMLEAFNLLFKEEMGFGGFGGADKKLELEIFKSKEEYQAYCDQNNLDCNQTLGFTHTRYREPKRQHGYYIENVILFYWDKDWRKFWDINQLESAKQKYYATLFHEATHQLLHAYTQKVFPRWLNEGLAVYFQNTKFNGKEIYLPKHLINPYARSMKTFLGSGGDPMEIFSWSDRTGNDLAYYGFSASFIFFLMRTSVYRHYVTDSITKLKRGLDASELGGFLPGPEDKKFWQSWRLEYEADINPYLLGALQPE